MHGQKVSLEVLINGNPLREYRHSPTDRVYVCMKTGDDYVLRVRNNTHRRVLVIPSVDGLSVMDGKTANWARGGYVVSGYGFVDVPGFRLDNDRVARFTAGAPGESYAALSDKPANIGVIGVAAFEEKVPFAASGSYVKDLYGHMSQNASPRLLSRSHGAAEADSYRGLEREEKTSGGLGTKFGAEAGHKVREVEFERATDHPAAVLAVHYDTADNLRRMGVLVYDDVAAGPAPNPFPENQTPACSPPAGWTPKG